MIAAFLIILSALARVVVGMGLASRWHVYPPVAFACAYFAFGISIATPIFALVMALTLGLGWTQWGNLPWMVLRYGLPPLVLTVAYGIAYPLTPDILAWALACTVYGAIDGDVRFLLEPYSFKVFGREVSSAQYAEALTGAVLLGGMSLL